MYSFSDVQVAPCGDVVVRLSCSDDSPLYSVVCFVIRKLPDVFGKFGAVGALNINCHLRTKSTPCDSVIVCLTSAFARNSE